MFKNFFALTLVACATRYYLFYKLSAKSEVLEPQNIRDPVEHQYFLNFSTAWESDENECYNVELVGKTDWKMPQWAEGLFITSGPAKHEMNDTKFNFLLDGFGKFSSVKFSDDKALFTSQLLKSQFYNDSLAGQKVASSILFQETTPPRWTSMVPGLNFYKSFKQDNNWVDFEMLADNKTFVGTTDTAIKLRMNPDTLEVEEKLEWQDNTNCMSGVSHSRRRADGTVISLCVVLNTSTGKMDLTVYKMDSSNIRNRQVIAKIPQEQNALLHAFALSKDYAIVFEPPYMIDAGLFDLVFKSVSAIDMIKNDVNRTTKIHAIRLDDGKVTTFDAGIWTMILHYGNSYQLDEDTLVVEGPAYEKADSSPFNIFLQKNMQDASGFTNHQFGSLWKRYILNFKTKTVKMEDLFHTQYGSLDLPGYNPKYEGVAKNRFSYIFQLNHQTKFDENYHWPIHKYDSEKEAIVATWGPNMTLCQEPRFIANPDGTAEEDGIIMMTVYNFYEKVTSIVIIDPKTMTTLQEYPLPFKLSIQFHNQFYPFKKIQDGSAQFLQE